MLQVAEALEAAYPEVNWFVNEVPDEYTTLPSLPIGRVVELNADYAAYASANPNYLNTYVQVDVWVKNVSDIKKYYYAMDKTMRDGGVQCAYSEQTYDQDLEGARRIIKRYMITQRVV